MNQEVKLLKRQLKEKLARHPIDTSSPETAKGQLSTLIKQFLAQERLILPRQEVGLLIGELLSEIGGLGPLEAILNDGSVTEVMVNKADEIYVEREGRLEKTEIRFESQDQLMHTLEKIVSPLGLRIDESSPMVDGRLSDGSRVNAIIPPLSLRGPAITIRRFGASPWTMKDLVERRTLSPAMAAFLEQAVKAKTNIVVSGGTGSGKTTFLNVLSGAIPPAERLVTIEDAAELRLNQPHIVSLEARPPNIEGEGEVTIRDLVRNALRMRPDRIIVGEVRGGEALDMLQAMNTGHEGSLTTAHANSCSDALRRLETMVLMSDVHLPVMPVREQIAAAIDLLVQLGRLSSGSRKVLEITALRGLGQGTYELRTLFRFLREGSAGDGEVVGRFACLGKPLSSDILRAKSFS